MKFEQTVFSKKSLIVLSCLSMLYITLVLCSAMLTNKIIAYGPAITLGGVLIVPFIFSVADIISEIFDYKIANVIVQSAFVFQLLFATICITCLKLNSPRFWHGAAAYHFVFSPLMRMSIASFAAYFIASLLNVYIISRWKALWKGRLFWVRSIGSSTIGECAYSILIILLMRYHTPSKEVLASMIVTSYIIKIVFSILFSLPANIIVFAIKKFLNIENTLSTNNLSKLSRI